jgi:acyl-CoA synthetase (AMP-forming)/AMP-acid ligase II
MEINTMDRKLSSPKAHLVSSDKLEPKHEHLIELLENNAYDDDHMALTYLNMRGNESKRSYRDLLNGARKVAIFLKNRGLHTGDKVVLILINTESFVNSFFGTIMAGGIPVAVSPPMTFGDIDKYLNNLRHILKNSQAKYMLSFPRIRKMIGSVLGGDNDLKEFMLYKEITDETPLHPGFPSIDPDAPALFQYTSGSTGRPKGTVLSHRALLANVAGISQGLQLSEQDVAVTWLPLFHDMGLIGGLLAGLYGRIRQISMTPESFVMNPVSWLEYLTRYKGSLIVAPNFAYHLLASRVTDEEVQKLDLSNLRAALNGAEPIDLRTLNAFEKKFRRCGFKSNIILPVYGMAENSLAATFPKLRQKVRVEVLDRKMLEVERRVKTARKDDPHPVKAVSVGSPIAGQELAIRNHDGSIADEGYVGEITIKSPSLMKSYHLNPDATAEVIKEGWLYTGDLGFVQNGRLFVTGRAKEMIIKRGRNYYPYDIERAAAKVAGVRKGCLVAFSIPNRKTGTEDLILLAETKEKTESRKKEVEKAISNEVLSTVGLKPDKTVLVPPRSIPKTSSGKIQRLLAKRRFMEGNLVKGASERWLTPVRTLFGSFLGNKRFRLRAR